MHGTNIKKIKKLKKLTSVFTSVVVIAF